MDIKIPLVLGAAALSHKWLDRNPGKIFYEATAPKPLALVCVPGIGDSLSSAHQVVLTDMRGIGDSTSDFTEYTPESVAEDIKAIIADMKLENVVLVGNSLSAGSALMVAAEGHAAVKGVIVFGPIVRDLPADKYFRPMSHVLFAWPWGASMWSMYFGSLFKRDTRPQGHAEHLSQVKRAIPQALSSVGKFARASKKGVESQLANVKVPVLAIFGDQDPDYPNPQAELEWFQSVLKGPATSASLLTKVGHYPHVEAWESDTHAKVQDFLKSL
ncbi:hypothetical protein HDU91_006372 [Kappamyces sp. JEL0680]|nr:hypothetical protein HDU91_006372 [Kappamyces sp. JEL0680]